jgi:hypothetical protein
VKHLPDYLVWNGETRQLQIDIPKLLRHHNLPDTEENRDMVTQVAAEVARREFPECSIDVNTAAYGTKRVFNPTKKGG